MFKTVNMAFIWTKYRSIFIIIDHNLLQLWLYYIWISYGNWWLHFWIITELDAMRSKMASYKARYNAGQLLPQDTVDDFFPDFVKDNSKHKVQIVDWMMEYNVPGNQHPCFKAQIVKYSNIFFTSHHTLLFFSTENQNHFSFFSLKIKTILFFSK